MDLKIALRSLIKHRAFSVAAILIIAAGSSFCIAAISFALAIAYPPPPFPEQDRVAEVWNGIDAKRPADYLTPARAHEWHETPLRGFDGSALASFSSAVLATESGNRQVTTAVVTGDFFDLLGIRAARGRVLDRNDDMATSEPAVVLGHALWLRKFSGDPGVIGRTLRINGEPRVVVGVAPANFHYPSNSELWLPLATVSEARRPPMYLLLGSFRPGSTIESVRAEATARASAELRSDSARYGNQGVAVVRAGDKNRDLAGTRLGLGIATGLAIFVAALANLAVLVLLRAGRAAHASAVRLALGASRLRLLRPLLYESGLIAVAGVALGIVLALWGAQLARVVFGINAQQLVFTVDARVAILAGAVVLLVMGVLATAPALLWRSVHPADLLRGGTFAIGRRGTAHVRNLLILTEVALTLTLAGGAIILLRSYRQFIGLDLGYDAASITMVSPLFNGSPQDPAMSTALVQNVLRSLDRDRSIGSAAAWRELSVTWGLNPAEQIEVSGRSEPLSPRVLYTRVLDVTPGFFDVFDLPPLQGRLFDGTSAVHSVVINKDAADLFFPGMNPIGQRIRIGTGESDQWQYVIGVVKNTATFNFLSRRLEIHRHRINPLIFRVANERIVVPTGWRVMWNGYSIGARAVAAQTSVVKPILAEFERQAPELAIDFSGTMEQFVNRWSGGDLEKAEAQVLGTFAGFALLLALFGIYAVIADSVRERHRELAVRVTLGASLRDIIRLVAGPSLAYVALGCTIAVVTVLLAQEAGRNALSLTANQQDIQLPLLPFAGVCAAVLIITLFAGLLGARGVMHVRPAQALRDS